MAFFGLASYLIFIGIYSSAVSVAEDSTLRRSIRRIAINESKLLDSIGMAQMELEIQRKIVVFTKRNQDKIIEETGIASSLSEEDVKEYLEQVINDVVKNQHAKKMTRNDLHVKLIGMTNLIP